MIRKRLLNILRSILFFVILVYSLYIINRTLMPKYILKNSNWPTTSSYYQFYKMDKNSIDVLFIGSSVVVNAFSPQEIYNNYGIRSYNLGSEQQSIFLSYFWLKEALRFQMPKVVVLDTRFLFEQHPEEPINTLESLTRKCLDPMKWSNVKIEAVSELCEIDESQSELSYYLTNIRFHTRWTGLTEYDVVKEEFDTSQLKGYAPISEYGAETYVTYTPSGDFQTIVESHELMQEYLDRMVALCKDNSIKLVLLSLPGSPMNDGINNNLITYANEKEVDYYNLCETEMYHSIGAILPQENTIAHANLWGAIKISQYIGNLLQTTYKVEATEDRQYEETKDYYEHIIKTCELPHITDINKYLNTIYNDNYTIFIAVRDDASEGLTDSIKNNLKKLGLTQNLTGKYRWGYCAVISSENGVSEAVSEEQVATLSGSMRNKNTFYKLSSGGYRNKMGITSSINIDGIEYSRNLRGLNFVIYDNDLMKVVDRVTFDISGAGGTTR